MNGTFWPSRPVFVTGATGFMGGWLAKALLDCGAEVVALVRDHTPRCIFVREKLHERAVVVNSCVALAEYSVDTVFHLAAPPLVSVAT